MQKIGLLSLKGVNSSINFVSSVFDLDDDSVGKGASYVVCAPFECSSFMLVPTLVPWDL